LDDNFFNPNVKPLGMDVRVDKAGQVKVLVFNITGEEVKKIADQQLAVGNYRFSWDGRNAGGSVVGSALYFIVTQQPSGKMVRKVIVLK
jgi:flagellar hook assembly protein FlgD